MNQLCSSRQVCELLDLPRPTLTYLVNRGAVHPVIPAAAQGSPRVFTLQQVWALGIAKSVRAGGQSLETACQISNALESMPPTEVEQAFKQGRTVLFVIGFDDQWSVLPRLVEPDAIVNNAELLKLKKKAQKQGVTTVFTGIDTKPMLDQLIAAMEKKK